MNLEEINKAISELEDRGDISDGYHTFEELYQHRHLLYLSLCIKYREYCYYTFTNADGSSWEDWFLLVLNHPKIKQISYHLPIELVDFCTIVNIEFRNKCDDYDGYTSNDVLDRLEDLVAIELCAYLDTLPKPEKPKIKTDKPALGIRREDIEKLRNTPGFTFVQKPLE